MFCCCFHRLFVCLFVFVCVVVIFGGLGLIVFLLFFLCFFVDLFFVCFLFVCWVFLGMDVVVFESREVTLHQQFTNPKFR